jgi:hypothetical protein
MSTRRLSRSVRRLAILAVVVVLPEPCRPHHQHGDRRRGAPVERGRVLAQHFHERVVDDLDDHLARRDRLHDLAADGALLDRLDERAHDLERHVGLDQRAAHLAHRGIDIGLRQRTAAGELVEDAAEPILQGIEHAILLSSPQASWPSGIAQTPATPAGEPSLAGGGPVTSRSFSPCVTRPGDDRASGSCDT